MQRENKSHEEIAREIVGKWGYEEEYWWKPIKEALDTAIAERDKEWEKAFRKAEKQYRLGSSDMNTRLVANTSEFWNFIKKLINK